MQEQLFQLDAEQRVEIGTQVRWIGRIGRVRVSSRRGRQSRVIARRGRQQSQQRQRVPSRGRARERMAVPMQRGAAEKLQLDPRVAPQLSVFVLPHAFALIVR